MRKALRVMKRGNVVAMNSAPWKETDFARQAIAICWHMFAMQKRFLSSQMLSNSFTVDLSPSCCAIVIASHLQSHALRDLLMECHGLWGLYTETRVQKPRRCLQVEILNTPACSNGRSAETSTGTLVLVVQTGFSL